jgi:hypothetical protein
MGGRFNLEVHSKLNSLNIGEKGEGTVIDLYMAIPDFKQTQFSDDCHYSVKGMNNSVS